MSSRPLQRRSHSCRASRVSLLTTVCLLAMASATIALCRRGNGLESSLARSSAAPPMSLARPLPVHSIGFVPRGVIRHQPVVSRRGGIEVMAEERKRRSYGDELSPEAQAQLEAWKRANSERDEDEEGFTLQNLDVSKIDAVTVNTILFSIIGFNFFILPFIDFTGILSAIVGINK
mmetsp:Transcript_28418/g.55300  ORF Transcript_28418/g.55300 Transcript_28418/m.55300 type:complete len:176 (+) Transcript_28418:2-529(+)